MKSTSPAPNLLDAPAECLDKTDGDAYSLIRVSRSSL